MQKQKYLMELVDSCPKTEQTQGKVKGVEVIDDLRDLGFLKATEKQFQANAEVSKRQRIYELEYTVITSKAIQKFLERKAKLYDKEHKPKKDKKKVGVMSEGLSEAAIGLVAHMARGSFGDLSEITTAITESPEDHFTLENLERLRKEINTGSMIEDARRSDALQMQANAALARRGVPIERFEHGIFVRNQLTVLSELGRGLETPVFSSPGGPPEGTIFLNPDTGERSQRVNGAWAVIPDGTLPTEMGQFCIKTCDYHSYENGTIGKFEWTEVPVEEYKGLPPEHVIETFKKHKEREVFDYFTIASVKGIRDPLILGRLKGDDENRWFIAQYGDDVCLDDLI